MLSDVHKLTGYRQIFPGNSALEDLDAAPRVRGRPNLGKAAASQAGRDARRQAKAAERLELQTRATELRFEGASLRQIAAALGCSERKVRKLLKEARRSAPLPEARSRLRLVPLPPSRR